jgi:hypothetical protein
VKAATTIRERWGRKRKLVDSTNESLAVKLLPIFQLSITFTTRSFYLLQTAVPTSTFIKKQKKIVKHQQKHESLFTFLPHLVQARVSHTLEKTFDDTHRNQSVDAHVCRSRGEESQQCCHANADSKEL